MSVNEMDAVWDSGLPQGLKSVALALADHADPNGVCWVSVDQIAAEAGCTNRHVRRTLIELKELGYVVVVEPATQYRAPKYRLNREALPAAVSGVSR